MTGTAIANGFDTTYQGEFSADLKHGVYRSFLPLAAGPNVASVPNLYLRNDLHIPGGGLFSLLTDSVIPLGTANSQKPWLAGTSDDFRHIVFESQWNLTGETTGGDPKVYEWAEGQLRLAGVLPNGTPASPPVLTTAAGASTNGYTPGTVSADGSRVFFQAGGSPGVPYVRINGRTSVQLTLSEKTPPAAPRTAILWTTSEDGSRAFLQTSEALTDTDTNTSNDIYKWELQPDDEQQAVSVDATGGTFTLTSRGMTTAPIAFGATPAQVQAALEALITIGAGNVRVRGGGADPYTVTFVGDLAGTNLPGMSANGSLLTGGAATVTVTTSHDVRNLERLSFDRVGADAPTADTVLGTSADGHYAYFYASQQLIVGEPAPAGPKLFVWHDGTVRYIGGITPADKTFNGPQANGGFIRLLNTARVSRDGRYLLFMSRSDRGLRGQGGFTGYDHGSTCTFDRFDGGPCRELYLYSADDGAVVCASCNPLGTAATQDAHQMVRVGTGASNASSQHLTRSLTDDGSRVFFSTAEALVPEDSNGASDAYMWDTAARRPHLISSGTSTTDSYFLDASTSGDDVFFVTRERLVGWDVDGNYDLYDARVGGGFPEPIAPAPSCAGSACQGSPTAAPASAVAASSLFSGAGDLIESLSANRRPAGRARPCRRGKVRKRIGGRVRCVSRRRASRAARQAQDGTQRRAK